MLPRSLGPRPYDVVVIGELAHQLMARCADDDPAVEGLVAQTLLFHDPEETAAWLSEVEVWIGRRLGPQSPWPEPPMG